MRWSKLKQSVEAFFAPCVKGRVSLRSTRYHKFHDQLGRGSIVVDGEEAISMATCTYEGIASERLAKKLKENGGEDWEATYKAVREETKREGILSQGNFHASLEEYLQMSIKEIMASSNPVIRGLGMLDKRAGKRTLTGLAHFRWIVPEEHPFPSEMLALRLEAEGLAHRPESKP